MANQSSLISIDKLVGALLFKEGKNNDDYLRYKQVVCDGIRNMHIHDFNVVVTKVVSVDSTTKTFDYPDDYVRYTSVSTAFDGRWWTFTRDDRLVPLQDDSAISQDIQSSIPNVATTLTGTSLSDGGGRNNYYFKPDDKNRRFLVGGFDADVVVLRYISNGLNTSGDVNVPDHAAIALEDWTRWRMSIHNREAVHVQGNNENIYIKSRLAMRKVALPNLDEIYDTIYRSSGQGARR